MQNGLYPYVGHDNPLIPNGQVSEQPAFMQVGSDYSAADASVMENFCANTQKMVASEPWTDFWSDTIIISNENDYYPYLSVWDFTKKLSKLVACGYDSNVNGSLNALDPYPTDGGKHCAYCLGYAYAPWGPNSLKVRDVSGSGRDKAYVQYGLTTNGTITNGWDYWWDIEFRGGSDEYNNFTNVNDEGYNHYHIDYNDYYPFYPTPQADNTVYIRGDCSNWTNGTCDTHPGFPNAVGNPHCPQGVCGQYVDSNSCVCHCPNGKVATEQEVCGWSNGTTDYGFWHGNMSMIDSSDLSQDHYGCWTCSWLYGSENNSDPWDYYSDWPYYCHDITEDLQLENLHVGIGTGFCEKSTYNVERCNLDCDNFCSHHALPSISSAGSTIGQPDIAHDWMQSPFYALDYPNSLDPDYRYWGNSESYYDVKIKVWEEMDYNCPGGTCAYHYTYPDNPYGAQKFRMMAHFWDSF